MLAMTGVCLRLSFENIGKAQKAPVCTNFEVLGSQNRLYLGCCWNGERQLPLVLPGNYALILQPLAGKHHCYSS